MSHNVRAGDLLYSAVKAMIAHSSLACGNANRAPRGDDGGLRADRGSPVRCWAGNAPPLVALVRVGALFHGKLLERPVGLASEPSPDTSVSEVA
ncbi:hypothetical protein [Rhodococcus pyridinivorans]|uniref:hypothetical protein n=1 Tax=Rhodococcus pyridinivorans TaxID=103816 RepID=UPI003F5CE179